MTRLSKISSYQLFGILLLSRLLSVLTIVSVGAEHMQTTDYLLAAFFGGIFILILSVPLFFFLKHYKGKDLVDLAFSASPLLSKGISLLYAVYFSYFALITLTTLKLFVGTSVFPNDESALFIVICIAAACYAASLGLEALGRASSIALWIFMISFGFIIAIMADKVQTVHFSPFLLHGFSPALEFGLRLASVTYEIAILFLLAPRITGNHKKMLAAWFLSFWICLFFIFFFTFGGLGEFAAHQLFPVYALSFLSEVSVFQRFDVLFTGVWILTAFLKISLLFYLQAELLKKSFPEKFKNQFIFLLAVLLLILQFAMRGKLTDYLALRNVWVRIGGAVVFLFLIPLVCMALERHKSKKLKSDRGDEH